jgi:hypothetical protein
MSEQHGSPLSHRESAATLLARPWRAGRSTGRAIYCWPGGDDDVIGMMDSRELAAAVVGAHNWQLVLEGRVPLGPPTSAVSGAALGLPVEAE